MHSLMHTTNPPKIALSRTVIPLRSIAPAQPCHGRQTICTPVRRLVACVSMDFELVGETAHVETIASGIGIRAPVYDGNTGTADGVRSRE